MFRKNSGIENFQAKEGGSFTVLSKIFSSHRSEKTSPGKYSVFQKISGREKYFMDKRGGGAYHDFPSKFLSHRTETKSFVKEPFCFPEIFWYRKNLWIRGGISRLSVEIFMSHRAENFRKEILLFLRKILVSKSFMDEVGGITFFRRKVLVSQSRKI